MHLTTLLSHPARFNQVYSDGARRRFEMRTWQDVRDIIGDAFLDATKKIKYCEPTSDRNRSRWPLHTLWQQFCEVISDALADNRSGVLPNTVIFANREAKLRQLDALLAGLLITRAAISGVRAEDFGGFLESHVATLKQEVGETNYQ